MINKKTLNFLENNKLIQFIMLVKSQILKFKIMDSSSQIAFYFTLSFFPFILIAITLVPLLPINYTPLILYAKEYIPIYLQSILVDSLSNYINNINISIISIGFIISIYSSSTVTTLIVKNINLIFETKLMEGTIFRRIWSIFLNFVIIFIIFLFAFISILIYNIINHLTNIINLKFLAISNILGPIFLFFFFFVIITALYRFSTPKKLKIKDIYIGSFLVSIFILSSFFIFNLYLNTFNVFLSYGMFGGVIILLLYFYILAFCILFGAIINKSLLDIKN